MITTLNMISQLHKQLMFINKDSPSRLFFASCINPSLFSPPHRRPRPTFFSTSPPPRCLRNKTNLNYFRLHPSNCMCPSTPNLPSNHPANALCLTDDNHSKPSREAHERVRNTRTLPWMRHITDAHLHLHIRMLPLRAAQCPYAGRI